MLTKTFKPLALAFLVNLIISVEDKIKYKSIKAQPRKPAEMDWEGQGHFVLLCGCPKMADEDYESVVCVKNEVQIYRIPPRSTNRGYR